MSRKNTIILITAMLLILSACTHRETTSQGDIQPPYQEDSETTTVPDSSDDVTSTTKEAETYDPSSIQRMMQDAMIQLDESISINIKGEDWTYGPENDLKNIYYSVLADHPELKYAYDMEASVSGDTAVCRFLYMPYKAGTYASNPPAGSHTISSLHDAEVMAQSMIDGTERMAIAITDPSLSPEDIQKALAQAGYGWIRFDLNRDGTEIVAQPPEGKTLAECASILNETFQLGGEILDDVVDNNMTDREKVRAIYDYIVQNVSYDFRYYSDRDNMPYESTTAIGALRDHLAICGGYAQAFETLLDMSGIENYTVAGMSKGEHHMWNYVILDGVGYYCDPTADRGGMSNHFLMSESDLSTSGSYEWESSFLHKISGITS